MMQRQQHVQGIIGRLRNASTVLIGLGLLGTPLWTSAAALYCTMTSNAAHIACNAEIQDDFWTTTGSCLNESEPGARRACSTAASQARKSGEALCEKQFKARLRVCDLVGEERYAPDFSPANFVDPNEIGKSVTPNPYFPLVPGTRWIYQGGEERITVTVTEKTKLIEGVTCRVVRDVVREDGQAIEITDDWYAQDLSGNVWYCGEESGEYGTFEGDNPAEAELVSIDGAWKTGRDRAKPGIQMFANPQVRTTYRQEFALGEAEDVATILSITGTESVPAASCNNDCLVTRDFTPISPGVKELKYYAPGVGFILEIDDEGNRTELIRFIQP